MTPAPHRIVLLPDGRPRTEPGSPPKVRRYRLARLRVADARRPSAPRFEHLSRTYD